MTTDQAEPEMIGWEVKYLHDMRNSPVASPQNIAA
jgi:hypothetical protein